MTRLSVPVLAACAALLAATPALAARHSSVEPLDVLASAPAHPRRAFTPEPYLGTLLDPSRESRGDARLGLPTFLWAAQSGPAAALRAQSAARLSHEGAARLHLAEYAELWQLTPAAARAATLRELHDTGTGALIARFTQSQGGVPVFRSQLNVVMDRSHQLIAVTGFLSPDLDPAAPAPAFPLDARDALSRALADLRGDSVVQAEWGEERTGRDGYQRHAPSLAVQQRLGLRFSRAPRTRRVLFQLPEGLVPAHYLELLVESVSGAKERAGVAYVFSAVDGRLLLRHDLIASDYSYRVWADPATKFPLPGPMGKGYSPYPKVAPDGTQPAMIAPSLLTLANFPFSKNDPWLAATATTTTGNNVDAYADLAAPDMFSAGDVRSDVTAPGVFDRTYDVSKAPDASAEQQKAAITQLFVMNNFLHDWYYDSGFDEKAGNAQTSNFGRGGLEGDALLAEAQDYSGTDNSNMFTPADGDPPQMQMFTFTLGVTAEVSLTAPAALAGPLQFGLAQFGPQTFDVTADLVATTPVDACGGVTNGAAVKGKIALIARGTCPFTEKVLGAQTAGAVGVIITNNADGLLTMIGDAPTITIPSVVILQADGDKIRTQTVTVTGRLLESSKPNRDGDLDGGIVAHEWGHYISNRLVGDGNGLINHQAGGMGEGWADFHAMLFQVRAADVAVAGNDQWQGAYAVAGYASAPFTADPMYFGIRRYPYSSDFAKNPLTFKHIQNGVAQPAGPGSPPISEGFLQDGLDNAEVHNMGEVWAEMLWECYSSLLRDTTGATPRLTFDQARDRMRGYIVAAYKITPIAPTMLEARDAVLAAAKANDVLDYAVFVKAFARRGAGTKAVGPDRYSPDNGGTLFESTDTGAQLRVESYTFDDSVTALCGADGDLQAGETGKLTFTLRNLGVTPIPAAAGSATSTLLTFPDGAAVALPLLAPGATATASLKVAMPAGTTGAKTGSVQITLNDAALSAPFTFTAARQMNVEPLAYQSATDDVESAVSSWTLSHSTDTDEGSFQNGKWRRVEISASDHRWFAPDFALGADQWLVSPPLALGAGPAKLSFSHRYNLSTAVVSFGGAPENIDGGVIEVSTDGATWSDIGITYPGKVITFDGIPLSGRRAFVAMSPGWPDAVLQASVTLPAKYANRTVQIRFRIVTLGLEGWGWEIDNLKLEGLTNLPFTALVPRGASCTGVPVARPTAPSTGQEGVAVQLDGSASTNAPGATGALTYGWFQVSGPAATLSSRTDARPTFTVKGLRKNEPVAFALAVSNGTVSSAPVTVSTVISHVAVKPVADAGAAQSVAPLAHVLLDGSKSSDPYGQPITYAWTQTGGPAVKLSTSGENATAQFDAPAEGAQLTFQLVVNNGELSSDPQTVTVTAVSSGCGCSSSGQGFSLPLAPVALLLAGLRRRRGKRA
jgi:MYXO-CTERM domain-containing protein